jgi:hypothetical protein
MGLKSTADRYGTMVVSIHWLSARRSEQTQRTVLATTMVAKLELITPPTITFNAQSREHRQKPKRAAVEPSASRRPFATISALSSSSQSPSVRPTPPG